MNTHEVLTRAAELLEAGEWTQNQLFSRQGGMCMYGAVRAVANENENLDLYWLGMLALRKLGLTTQFNDEPGRTKEDVVEALRTAALIYAPVPAFPEMVSR